MAESLNTSRLPQQQLPKESPEESQELRQIQIQKDKLVIEL